jgi:16S rRNA (uracil1498-N3)-methyltransferase
MKRIYYPHEIDDSITITGDYLHYLKNVIRAKAGDSLGVLGVSEYAECKIADISKKSAELEIIDRRTTYKHDYSLKVYQCLLKREYMDFAVEKYSELGATEIVPVISDRSLNDLKDKTLQRFKDISTKAVLQSENEQMPAISDAIDIADVSADADSNIIFYERCEDGSQLKPAKDMSIIIGPEGGFTDEEYELLVSKGFTPVRPISQILKAETASVVFTGYVRILQENI